jgi:hypothetical protein
MTDEIKQAAEVATTAAEDKFLAGVFPPAKNTVPEVRSDPVAESGSTESEQVTESDADLERASTVLALDGVSPAIMARLDRAEVLEWASKAKERQAKTAQELQARAERIKQLESVKPTAEKEAPKSPTASVEPDEIAAIRERFGDELAAPLVKMLEKQRSAATEREREIESRLGLLSSLVEKQLVTSAKASLREMFPLVDDPTRWPEVEKELAHHVAKHRDAGKDAEQAYFDAARDAARVVFFDEARAAEAGRTLAGYRKRLASQPTPPTGKPAATKAMSASEREDALLTAIFSGDKEAKERLTRAV